MLDFTGVKNYYIRCGYTDMRKQIDGLAALVKLEYDLGLNEESLFLFCGRKADRICRRRAILSENSRAILSSAPNVCCRVAAGLK